MFKTIDFWQILRNISALELDWVVPNCFGHTNLQTSLSLLTVHLEYIQNCQKQYYNYEIIRVWLQISPGYKFEFSFTSESTILSNEKRKEFRNRPLPNRLKINIQFLYASHEILPYQQVTSNRVLPNFITGCIQFLFNFGQFVYQIKHCIKKLVTEKKHQNLQ